MNLLEFKEIKTKGIAGNTFVKRAKVIGGWLVLVTQPNTEYQESHTKEYGFSRSITFVPDPEHKWE